MVQDLPSGIQPAEIRCLGDSMKVENQVVGLWRHSHMTTKAITAPTQVNTVAQDTNITCPMSHSKRP